MAGDTTLPLTYNTGLMKQSAIDQGLYRDVRNGGSDYIPKAGDIFYKPRSKGGHVGFIASVEVHEDGTYTIITMEGNAGDQVAAVEYTGTIDNLGEDFEGFIEMNREEKTSCTNEFDLETVDTHGKED